MTNAGSGQNTFSNSKAGRPKNVKKLLAIARNENLSKVERSKAVKELSDISPECFGCLDNENFSVDDLIRATQKYIKTFLKIESKISFKI
jgi:hypothetical protein